MLADRNMTGHILAFILTAQVLVTCAVGCVGNGVGLDSTGQPVPLNGGDPDPGEDTDNQPDGGDLLQDGGDNGDEEAPAATLREIQSQIFKPNCATEEGHVIGIAPHGLMLSEGFSHGLLVDVQADENEEMVRVVPGDPENSYLMVKLSADDPRNLKRRMPRDGPPFLSEEEIEMIRSWIAAGAEDN